MLDRADHEPQVAEHRQHLAYGQVGEHHGEHGRCAKNIDAELKQQTTGAVRGVGFPLRTHGVITDLLGTHPQTTKEITLAVTGAHFLDSIQGFGQGLGEA
ncbi:hypothetical protein D3C75_1188780 [compost metagenome]